MDQSNPIIANQEAQMTDNTPPIELNVQITLWLKSHDDKGNRFSQLTIEKAPRVLYEFIPLKEYKVWIDPKNREFCKDIEFMFKRRKYVFQVCRTKEIGEP